MSQWTRISSSEGFEMVFPHQLPPCESGGCGYYGTAVGQWQALRVMTVTPRYCQNVETGPWLAGPLRGRLAAFVWPVSLWLLGRRWAKSISLPPTQANPIVLAAGRLVGWSVVTSPHGPTPVWCPRTRSTILTIPSGAKKSPLGLSTETATGFGPLPNHRPGFIGHGLAY